MTDVAQELYIKWAKKRWPDLASQISRVMVDGGVRYEGYCDTCRYETSDVEVTLYNDKGRSIYSGWMYTDLASLLREILESGND